MKQKSQASMEFIIFISMAIFTFLFFVGIMFQHTLRFNKERAEVLVEDITTAVQYEFFLAKSVKDGYIRYFSVPYTLDGLNYTINIIEDSVVVSSGNAYSYAQIPNITINNAIQKGMNKINKTNGTIYLN